MKFVANSHVRTLFSGWFRVGGALRPLRPGGLFPPRAAKSNSNFVSDWKGQVLESEFEVFSRPPEEQKIGRRFFSLFRARYCVFREGAELARCRTQLTTGASHLRSGGYLPPTDEVLGRHCTARTHNLVDCRTGGAFLGIFEPDVEVFFVEEQSEEELRPTLRS